MSSSDDDPLVFGIRPPRAPPPSNTGRIRRNPRNFRTEKPPPEPQELKKEEANEEVKEIPDKKPQENVIQEINLQYSIHRTKSTITSKTFTFSNESSTLFTGKKARSNFYINKGED